MADWSGLPKELLELIAQKFTRIADHRAFRNVCQSWRKASRNYKVVRSRLPRQLPILLTADGSRSTHRVFSLAHRTFHSRLVRMNCRGSFGSILLSVGTEYQGLHLYEPFYDGHLTLPPVNTFSMSEDILDCFNCQLYFFKKGACFWTKNFKEFVVVVIHGDERKLSFAKETDNCWNLIEESQWHPFVDVIHVNGQFYVVNRRGQVVVCNFGSHPMVTEFAPALKEQDFTERQYLVESSGEFFQIIREMEFSDDEENANANDDDVVNANDNEENVNDNDDVNVNDADVVNGNANEDNEGEGGEIVNVNHYYKTIGFKVFKFYPGQGKWIEVKSIEDRAFFLGSNSSFSICASDFLGCSGNCIYFTNDNLEYHIHLPGHYGGFDMGVYNLADGSIEPFYPNTSKRLIPAPVFMEPIPWH